MNRDDTHVAVIQLVTLPGDLRVPRLRDRGQDARRREAGRVHVQHAVSNVLLHVCVDTLRGNRDHIISVCNVIVCDTCQLSPYSDSVDTPRHVATRSGLVGVYRLTRVCCHATCAGTSAT